MSVSLGLVNNRTASLQPINNYNTTKKEIRAERLVFNVDELLPTRELNSHRYAPRPAIREKDKNCSRSEELYFSCNNAYQCMNTTTNTYTQSLICYLSCQNRLIVQASPMSMCASHAISTAAAPPQMSCPPLHHRSPRRRSSL
jgi:hypothetical protein